VNGSVFVGVPRIVSLSEVVKSREKDKAEILSSDYLAPIGGSAEARSRFA
jgi:hypothetical protein